MPIYTSIDDLVQKGGLDLVQQELNASPLYVGAVHLLRWREIGLRIWNNSSAVVGEYSSHHDSEGIIQRIDPYFTQPNIIVTASEPVLLEIAQRVEWVRSHIFQAVLQYGPKFQMDPQNYRRIMWAIIKTGRERLSLP